MERGAVKGLSLNENEFVRNILLCYKKKKSKSDEVLVLLAKCSPVDEYEVGWIANSTKASYYTTL